MLLWRFIRTVIGSVAAALVAAGAQADPLTEPGLPWLTGNCGGLCTRLFERGIDPQLT